ncbi:hypothetical protein [Weissella confusa]|uniref:hypothetical protein n=1 Tax=Weissella confusa TaxID=1583 RepID=UPI001080F13A|nr:hypothetical protein [Weissella confusa]
MYVLLIIIGLLFFVGGLYRAITCLFAWQLHDALMGLAGTGIGIVILVVLFMAGILFDLVPGNSDGGGDDDGLPIIMEEIIAHEDELENHDNGDDSSANDD